MIPKTFLPAVLVLCLASVSQAGGVRKNRSKVVCEVATECVTTTFVEQTILVPHTVIETRKVQTVEEHPEEREKTFTVFDTVPVTKTISKQETIMVDETRTRTETYTVTKPVWKDVSEEYTVQAEHTEVRQGCRTVTRMVPAKRIRTYCVDEGRWEHRCELTTVAQCNCGTPTCQHVRTVRKIWVSRPVKRRVVESITIRKQVQEPYSYTVKVCQPETRTRTKKVCEHVEKQKTREVKYTVKVPQVQTKNVEVTEYKKVPRQVTEKYTVMVPRTVEKEVQVEVCRMVPQTIRCEVPVCEQSSISNSSSEIIEVEVIFD